MKILHLCPASLATGGTEGIHNLVSHLNACGADAKILYVGKDLKHPQPTEYAKYNCEYITEFPHHFDGVVIFPEVWGNAVIKPEYKNCLTSIHWQGVDVYDWHTPKHERGLYLQSKSTVHIVASEYARVTLQSRGLTPVKISDCLNDDYFENFGVEYERTNTVLYNPVRVKMTRFQEAVMARSTTELGIKFKPIQGYTRSELIDLFRHSKLYIDFGVFSGRERLPREAVMCGCCILTSTQGTAGYYLDNPIPDKYKLEDIDEAIKAVEHVLENYEACRIDFEFYREALKQDKKNYLKEVEDLYNVIFNSYSCL